MKITIFSVFVLALSAIASPVPQANTAIRPIRQPNDVVKHATDAVTQGVSVKQVLNEATTKRAITDPQVFFSTLNTTVYNVHGFTAGTNNIADKVKSGAITKSVGANQAILHFKAINYELTEIATKFTGAAKIDFAAADVNAAIALVVTLVSDVLNSAKAIVSVIGLRPELLTTLFSVLNVLAKDLDLIIGFGGSMVPGLISALGSLVDGVVNGPLAPLLHPFTDLLVKIAA